MESFKSGFCVRAATLTLCDAIVARVESRQAHAHAHITNDTCAGLTPDTDIHTRPTIIPPAPVFSMPALSPDLSVQMNDRYKALISYIISSHPTEVDARHAARLEMKGIRAAHMELFGRPIAD